ncbi:MAG: hypothetical protein JXR10_16785 [Cyclobacteriaceae bacterium]
MIEDSHLPFFINEDLYILKEEKNPAEKISKDASGEVPTRSVKPSIPSPAVDKNVVNEPTPSIPKIKEETKTPVIPEKSVEVEKAALAIWAPPLMKEDEVLLHNILKAIDQDFSKAKLMSGIAAYEEHYEKLLCFGYQKELELKIGKAIPLYQVTSHESQTILVSAAPEGLHSDKNEKMKLWGALQKMFPKG